MQSIYTFAFCVRKGAQSMKKQPEITDATREAFISAFCEFYMERPIEKITVKYISAKAGYSRTTFYNYFHDSYDVLEYIEDGFIASLEKNVAGNIQRDNTLADFVLLFVKMVREQGKYSLILLNNPNNTQFAERIKKVLLPAVLSAFGQTEENKRAVYAFEFYIPGVVSIISRWMRSGQDMPVEELADIVQGILKRGVLAQFV